MGFYEKHEAMLDRALTAIRQRGYWSAFNESPSPRVYGESAAPAGRAAFEAYLGGDFPLDQPGHDGPGGDRASPFGVELDVTARRTADVDALLAAATAAVPSWRDAGPQVRAGVCLEILAGSAHIFELANAVQYTTGQAFVMAFQAGGAHALDRALEAVAYAYAEKTRTRPAALGEAAGQGRAAADGEDVHVGAARASGWSSAATRSRPGTPTRACSRRWPPATRSSSSRTRARCCRWRSPCRYARRCWPRPVSTRTW